MTTSSKKGKIDKPESQEISSRRKGKIIQPFRRGTVSQAAIKKAIKKVMARRSSS